MESFLSLKLYFLDFIKSHLSKSTKPLFTNNSNAAIVAWPHISTSFLGENHLIRYWILEILRKATTPEIKKIAVSEGFRTMQDMGRELILTGDLNFREYDRVLSLEQ